MILGTYARLVDANGFVAAFFQLGLPNRSNRHLGREPFLLSICVYSTDLFPGVHVGYSPPEELLQLIAQVSPSFINTGYVKKCRNGGMGDAICLLPSQEMSYFNIPTYI